MPDTVVGSGVSTRGRLDMVPVFLKLLTPWDSFTKQLLFLPLASMVVVVVVVVKCVF